MTGGESGASSGLPRAYLSPCLLLLLAEGAAHGYELQEQLVAIGLERADSGGMYRSLRTLERRDLVRSWWEPSTSGPSRRRYELTENGLERLHAWAGTLREVHRLLGEYLERYERIESPCTNR